MKGISILKSIWKDERRWLALLSVIIAFFWLFFVCTDYGSESTYYCSTGTDIPETAEMVPCTNLVQTFQTKEGRLNSLEFYFTGVPEEKVGGFVLTIESDEGVLYQSNLSLSNLASDAWYRRYINIPMHEDVIYKLQLKAVEGTEAVPYVYIMDEVCAPSEAVHCYINGMETGAAASIRYGYLKPYGASDRAIQVFLMLVCLVVFWSVLATWEQWKVTRKKIGIKIYDFVVNNPTAFMLIQIILVRVIIEHSGIAFQPATEILFFLGSVFACLNIKGKLDYVIPILKNPRFKWGFLLLDFYAAFALVGNRMFIYPLNKTVTVEDILIFLTAVIWFLAILVSIMYYYEKLAIRLKQYKTGAISSVRFGIYAAILLILPAIVALYAFNPGISSSDTVYCMATAAHHPRGMGNWQAPFYIMLLSLIIRVWDSTYMVIAVQFFFWIYVMLEMLSLLRRRGWNEKLLLVAAFLTGCNVANFIHLCTIWKDIPYTLSVLWVTVILSKLVLESDRYQKSFYIYLELVVALVFMCLVRNNGIVPYILVGILASVLLWKNRRVLVAVAVSVAMVIMVRIPVYHYLEIQNTYTGGEYIGLGQDILGAYYAGGDLSEDTLKMVRVLTGNNTGECPFNPCWAYSSADLNVSKAEFIWNYIDTFLHNPIVMGREIVCRQDAVWDIFDGERATLNCVGYLDSMETSDVWASYYPKRNVNVLTGQLTKVVQYSSTSQLLRITQWRMGLMTLLGVSSIFILIYKRKRIPFLIYVPILGHILSLMLSTGWSDFRYYWAINLVSWFILLLLPTITHGEENEKLEQKKQGK